MIVHPRHRPRRRFMLAALLVAAIGSAGALCVREFLREPGADAAYDTRVPSPALAQRAPRVLFDEGHHNSHSLRGRFAPFADLLRADGCRVRAVSAPITPALLASADILVIVNASGSESARESSAFTDAEIGAVRDWVRAGGSLLLASDHHPIGPANAPLAAAFGVRMVGGWCDDENRALKGTADSGAILFTRDAGALGDHPILRGRGPDDEVRSVATFTGQSLVAPANAVPLLLLSSEAMDRVPVAASSKTEGGRTTTTFETADSSAAGHCQALALEEAKGRVLVLAEAAMLSAQLDRDSGLPFGMNVPGVDNRRFTLNAVRWLARELN